MPNGFLYELQKKEAEKKDTENDIKGATRTSGSDNSELIPQPDIPFCGKNGPPPEAFPSNAGPQNLDVMQAPEGNEYEESTTGSAIPPSSLAKSDENCSEAGSSLKG